MEPEAEVWGGGKGADRAKAKSRDRWEVGDSGLVCSLRRGGLGAGGKDARVQDGSRVKHDANGLGIVRLGGWVPLGVRLRRFENPRVLLPRWPSSARPMA